jgi:lactate dehydrogenase-like 2-hydroxyacid dehydrogenase
MKIGFFGKQNAFAMEMLRRLQLDQSRDDFSSWQPGEEAPSTDLEVIIAFDSVASKQIEAQAKLGLIQMASAGYEGVDVDAATEAGSGWAQRASRRRATVNRWRKLLCC